jgi:hypothetical protein
MRSVDRLQIIWRVLSERARFFWRAGGVSSISVFALSLAGLVFAGVEVLAGLRELSPITEHLPPLYIVALDFFKWGAPWVGYLSLGLWAWVFEYLFRMDRRNPPERAEFDELKSAAEKSMRLHRLIQLRSAMEEFERKSDEAISRALESIDNPRPPRHRLASLADQHLRTGDALEAEFRRLTGSANMSLGAGSLTDEEATTGAATRPPMATDAMRLEHYRFSVNSGRQRQRLKQAYSGVVASIHRLTSERP